MSVNQRNLSIKERPVAHKPSVTIAMPSVLSSEEDEIIQLPWMIRLTVLCLLATALGWLLSCDDETAHIFRAGQAGYETVQGFERELSGEDVLVGFVLNLQKLR